MVDIDYRNCNDGSAENMFFMMMIKTEDFDVGHDESFKERCRSNVVGWVEELGVDRQEPVFEATVQVVLYSIKQLVEEVRHKGRKTLCMSVDIEVYHSDPQEEEEEDGMEEVEEEEESDKEKHYEIAKGVLEASGVRFGKVSSVVCGCCPICLDEFEAKASDQAEVAMLPCSHILHLDCLLPWLACGGSNCPLCRADVLAKEFMEC